MGKSPGMGPGRDVEADDFAFRHHDGAGVRAEGLRREKQSWQERRSTRGSWAACSVWQWRWTPTGRNCRRRSRSGSSSRGFCRSSSGSSSPTGSGWPAGCARRSRSPLTYLRHPPSPAQPSRRIGPSSLRSARPSSSPFFVFRIQTTFHRTQRISSVPRQRSVVRSAFPESAAHFQRLRTTDRRTRRNSIVRSAFPESADNGPLHAAHFQSPRRISSVCGQRTVVRGAFPESAAHFQSLQTTDRRTQRISIGSRRRPVLRGAFRPL